MSTSRADSSQRVSKVQRGQRGTNESRNARALSSTLLARMTNETIDSALDAAVDAIARRARVLDACDPEIAEAMRELATKLRPEMLGGGK